LHHAAGGGHAEAMKLLLKAGANKDEKDIVRDTSAVYMCENVKNGSVFIFKCLQMYIK
jgi:ankyrin repeat protein